MTKTYNVTIAKAIILNIFKQYNVKYRITDKDTHVRLAFARFDVEIYHDYTYVLYQDHRFADDEVEISSFDTVGLRKLAGMIAFLQGPSDER